MPRPIIRLSRPRAACERESRCHQNRTQRPPTRHRPVTDTSLLASLIFVLCQAIAGPVEVTSSGTYIGAPVLVGPALVAVISPRRLCASVQETNDGISSDRRRSGRPAARPFPRAGRPRLPHPRGRQRARHFL